MLSRRRTRLRIANSGSICCGVFAITAGIWVGIHYGAAGGPDLVAQVMMSGGLCCTGAYWCLLGLTWWIKPIAKSRSAMVTAYCLGVLGAVAIAGGTVLFLAWTHP